MCVMSFVCVSVSDLIKSGRLTVYAEFAFYMFISRNSNQIWIRLNGLLEICPLMIDNNILNKFIKVNPVYY